ncbi:MAG: dehydrogenase [Prevotella sp.]|nr:dehydrogenase [Prevotella sp.]
MADNYLEYRREAYEKLKKEWLRKKKHVPSSNHSTNNIPRPEDESL